MRTILLCGLLCFSVRAQSRSANLNTHAAACGSPPVISTGYVFVPVNTTNGSATITISGTWSGTISFFGSGDGGTTWSAIYSLTANSSSVSTATGNGTWQFNPAGYSFLCAAFTTATSGTAVTTIQLGQASARASGGGGGGSPGGSSSDIQYNNAGSFGGDTCTTDGSGNLTCASYTATGSYTAPLGGSTTPTYNFTGYTTTGLFATSSTLGFIVNGSERAYTNNANFVSVGTLCAASTGACIGRGNYPNSEAGPMVSAGSFFQFPIIAGDLTTTTWGATQDGSTYYNSTVKSERFWDGTVIEQIVSSPAGAPTVSSGFGTGASVTSGTAPQSFTVNVGTSNTGTGILVLPAAPTAWNCFVTDITTTSTAVSQTKSVPTGGNLTTEVTLQNYTDISGTGAWVDSDVLAVSCFSH